MINQVNIDGIVRASPLFLLFSSISDWINEYDSVFFPILLYCTHFLNEYLKELSHKYLGNSSWGLRPTGAINCGLFIDENNPKKNAKSYGMPSGHTHFASAFATYHFLKNKNPWWFLIALLIGYSRIYLNCHTISQVIIGFIIGTISGIIIYYSVNTLQFTFSKLENYMNK